MRVIIKFVTDFVAVLSGVVFSISLADCTQYKPEEETERFRNTVSTPHFKGLGSITLEEAPSRIRDLNNLSEIFPDFQVINNHLLCKGCSYLPSVAREEPSECCYADLRCREFVIYTLVIERYPDKATAMNYLETKSLSCLASRITLEEVKNPEEAHVVIYSDGKHYGIYRGKGIVESKWGYARAIFRHKLWQIPLFYGNQVRFYKVGFL